MRVILLAAVLSGNVIAVEPMESRLWRTTSGHDAQARAISATAASVTLELANGRRIELPMEKLIPEQRNQVQKHFGITPPKEGEAERGAALPLGKEDAGHPLGKVVGPIEAAPGSHYHLYLPKSLKKGRKAPLLHFNDSGRVNPAKMNPYVAACERFGWILAGSVESRNQTHGEKNLAFAAANVAHLKKSGLVDEKRIYFTGGSGGGAMSWWNYHNLNGAGTMPVIGYIPSEITVSKGHHFVLGGATDYNRYLSAHAASLFKDDAVYRPYPGRHSRPKEEWILMEGVAWLTAKYLHANARDANLAGDRLDFEGAMIDWISESEESAPHLAYRACVILQDVYKISGKNAGLVEKAASELGKDANNVKFADGLEALSEFGTRNFSELGGKGSLYGTAVPGHSRKAEMLAAKYGGVPFVEQTFKELAEPTLSK